MTTTCKHCEVLNVLSLVDQEFKAASREVSEKFLRYYCKNEEKDNILCPNSGQKDVCRTKQ